MGAVRSRPRPRSVRVGLVVVLGLFALVFGRAAGHGFVWDDLATVVDNPWYRAPLAETLRATQHDQLDPTLLGVVGHPVAYESYRPLLLLSYRLDDRWFGRSARAMHLHNLLLGILAVCAAAWVSHRWLGDPRLALVATAIFALHPVQVESLCYVSARGDLLAGLLCLLSTGAFLAALEPDCSRRRRATAALAAAVAFVAALGAKEAAATLPLALAALALARRRLRAAAWPLAGLIAGLLAYLALRTWSIGSELSRVDQGVAWATLWRGPAYALACLRVLVAPYDLSIERPAPGGAAWLLMGWASVLAAGWLVARILLGSRTTLLPRAAAAGVVWFGALVAPSLVAVETTGVLADRYAYQPLLGVAIAFAVGASAVARHAWGGGPALPVAAGAWAALCLAVSAQQVGVWRDNGALYAHATRAEPGSSMAHYRLGVVSARRGAWPRARRDFDRAVALDGSNVRALNNLGVSLLHLGRLEEAGEVLGRALEESGERHFRAWNNLAQVHFAAGRPGAGCAALTRSLAINPSYEVARRGYAHRCGADRPAAQVEVGVRRG